ncbi:MAG: hypothetical protein RR623_09635 [Bacilli bacterium]
MKKCVIFASLTILLLTGCTIEKSKIDSNANEEPIHSTKISGNRQLTLDEVETKMKNKETFVVIVTLPQCDYCENYKKNISSLVNKFDYEINECKITSDEMNKKYSDFIRNHPYDDEEQEILFPSTIVIKKGLIVGNSKGVLSEETFKEWINIKMNK